MHSRLEKPIIREERAETSAAAFIKFAFSIARSNKWETQERVFEEEGLIFNLSLKRGSLRKYKDYSWAFENDERPISKAIFQNSNRLPKTQEREIEDGSLLKQNRRFLPNWDKMRTKKLVRRRQRESAAVLLKRD